MGTKIHTPSISQLQITKKNLLFLTILVVSAVFAIAVFGLPVKSGVDVRLVTNGSQNYINSNMTETVINFTIQFFTVQWGGSQNMTGFNISTTNNSLNFTRIVSANDTGITNANCQFANSTNGSYVNCSNVFAQNFTNTSTQWVRLGLMGELQGQYLIVINATTNQSGNSSTAFVNADYGDLRNNVLLDYTIPNATNYTNNGTALSAYGSGAWFNRSLNVSVFIGDISLNVTNTGGTVNVTIKNITAGNDSSATTFATPRVDCIGGKGNNWVCFSNFTITGTEGLPLQNFTYYVTASDNASNSINVSASQWFVYDNSTPNLTSVTPGNNSNEVSTTPTLTIVFSELMNRTSVNDTSNYNLSFAGAVGGAVNFTVSSSDSATATTVTITPTPLNYSTTYNLWINEKVNASSIRDIVGNFMNFTIMYSFATLSAGGTGGGGGGSGGGGGAGISIPDIVSEAKPTATLSMNEGDSGGVSVGGKRHTIKIISISGGIVRVEITSIPIIIDLRANVPAYVDVDADGDNDLIITVLEILSTSAARIKFDYLADAARTTGAVVAAAPTPVPGVPEVPEAVAGPAPAEVSAEEEAAAPQPLSQNALIGIVLVVIIVLVGLGYWYSKK